MSETTPTSSYDIRCESTVAACAADFDETESPFLVSGVAIGEDEVTHGKNGAKFWPRAELQASASTLAGSPLTKNHNSKAVEAVVGQVTRAAYRDGLGVIYEAEVDDPELAQKIERGRLDVSIHAVHTDGGEDDAGRMIAENIEFVDLSLVPIGAAATNEIEMGESDALASAELSASDLTAELDDADISYNATTESMTDESDESDATEASDTTSEPEPDVDDDVEAEASDEPESQPDEAVEADVSELQECVDELEAANEELRAELESVRLTYAERLADGAILEADELAERFSFDELREKFEERDTSLVESEAGNEPVVEAGEATEEPDTEPESEELSEQDRLEQKLEAYEARGLGDSKAAENVRNQLD